MSFQMLAATEVDCRVFKHSVSFMQVEVKKYQDEKLNFSIEVDQNCSLKDKSKIHLYWKADKGKAQSLGYDCAYPSGLIQSLVELDDFKKLDDQTADVRMDVLEVATKNTDRQLDEWIQIKTKKVNGKCVATTNVIVDSLIKNISRIYIDKATLSFTLSPRITKAILFQTNGKTIKIEKD